MKLPSLRYSSGKLDFRSYFIRLCGWLQHKEVFFLDSDPKACAHILTSSNTKGSFVERILATPAWSPIYSIESVDGELWEQLAHDCRNLIGELNWRSRLPQLVEFHGNRLTLEVHSRRQSNPQFVIDAEMVSRFTVRTLFELLFDIPLSPADETLFYQASIEWRKEIGVKGQGDLEIKQTFYQRLTEIIAASKYAQGLSTYRDEPKRWISIFAQPFLISPQINVSDVLVAVFDYLRREPGMYQKVQGWAESGNTAGLNAVVMESIRLKHPFPILERELEHDLELGGRSFLAGSQIFILLDRFKQDQNFDPERWLQKGDQNIYSSIPFGTGKRMCIGKPIALEFLSHFLRILLTQIPADWVQPQQGHLYSGRNNDQGPFSFAEAFHQMKTFTRAFKKSFQLGQQTRNKNSRCPIQFR